MLSKPYRALLPLALLLLSACSSPAQPVAQQPSPAASTAPAASPSPAADASVSAVSASTPTLVAAASESPGAAPSAPASAAPSASASAVASAAPSTSASAPSELTEVAILELGGQLRIQRGDQQQSLIDLEGDDLSRSDLVWSPDGWRLATADGIRTFGAENTPPVVTPLSGFRFRWSPDSQQLAWMLAIEEHADALIIGGPDGDQPRQADTGHWGLAGLPDWRPDGQIVVAGSLTAAADGSSALPALPEERGQDAAWSPDGRALAWTAINDDGLTITRTLTLWDGAATREIGALTATRSEANSQIDWATTGFDPPRLFWLPDTSGVLLPIPPEGLREGAGTWLIQRDGTATLLSPAMITDLATDGQRMLARSSDNQIVVVRLDDGTIERELGPGVLAAWRPAPTGAPPSAPLAEKSPTLARQSPALQGDAVRDLQQRLLKLGYDPGAIDGIFGPQTEQAVREFQEQQGLSVDGVVGPRTWAELRAMEWVVREPE